MTATIDQLRAAVDIAIDDLVREALANEKRADGRPTFDPCRGAVTFDGHTVRVDSGQLGRLAATLIAWAGEYVPFSRIKETVWGDESVDDHRIGSAVSRLRDVLRASGHDVLADALSVKGRAVALLPVWAVERPGKITNFVSNPHRSVTPARVG